MPPLILYVKNIGEIQYDEILRALIIVCILAFVIQMLFEKILKIESNKAFIITAVFIILFFFFGHLKFLAFKWFHNDLLYAKYDGIVLYAFIMFLFFILSLKTKKLISVFKRILIYAGWFLVLYVTFNIARVNCCKRQPKYNHSGSNNNKKLALTTSYKPNILLIIVDAYPRADALKTIYNFDNSDFIQYLELKGFYCASQSMSNYQMTYLSLQSLFGMKLIDNWNDILNQELLNEEMTYKFINNSYFIKFIKSLNYKYISFSPNMGDRDINKADYKINSNINYSLNAFESVLVDYSPLAFFLNEDNHFKIRRNKLLNQFSFLAGEKMKSLPEPYFLYAHIMAPHPPFVLNENGDFIKGKDKWKDRGDFDLREGILSIAEYKKYYIDSIKFANKKIKRIVENLMSLKSKPVIIIMSDHGSRMIFDVNDRFFVKEKLFNFLSVYTPHKSAGKIFYKNVTPVNVFPVILNAYFNANISLSEDSGFFEHPPHFIENYSECGLLETR